jgi:hypothetical protein
LTSVTGRDIIVVGGGEMPVQKTSMSFIEEHWKILEILSRKWNATKAGVVRRIITEWLQYEYDSFELEGEKHGNVG